MDKYKLYAFLNGKCIHSKSYETKEQRSKDEFQLTKIYGSRAGFETKKVLNPKYIIHSNKGK